MHRRCAVEGRVGWKGVSCPLRVVGWRVARGALRVVRVVRRTLLFGRRMLHVAPQVEVSDGKVYHGTTPKLGTGTGRVRYGAGRVGYHRLCNMMFTGRPCRVGCRAAWDAMEYGTLKDRP